MKLLKFGHFNVYNCINKDCDVLLPPSSPLYYLLATFWPVTFRNCHFWWNYDELFDIVLQIVKQYEVNGTVRPRNTPLQSAYGIEDFALDALSEMTRKMLFDLSALNQAQLTSFFNPICGCDLCKQDRNDF